MNTSYDQTKFLRFLKTKKNNFLPKHSILTAAAKIGFQQLKLGPFCKALYKPVILLQKTLSLKERSGRQAGRHQCNTWND